MPRPLSLLLLSFCLCLLQGAESRLAYQLPMDSELLLSQTIQETFECFGRPFGYYADVDNECRIFHICQPIVEEDGTLLETAHFSFICGNGTMFDQRSLVCVHDALVTTPCQEASLAYDASNAIFDDGSFVQARQASSDVGVSIANDNQVAEAPLFEIGESSNSLQFFDEKENEFEKVYVTETDEESTTEAVTYLP